ncbi:MAG: hypothetical protein A2289_16450 [Deltaproteobacteria bacterium RIFOXYA12_FULL_58_15]|nr:MAG: hypothetical protein A2289_16450 [Deltaproteobacteria bacterium RIFOXYA12_FULL_58_15]
MTSISGSYQPSLEPLAIEFVTNNQYALTEGRGQPKNLTEVEANKHLAAYGIAVVGGDFRSVDGFKLTETSAPIVTQYGDAPILPDFDGVVDNNSLAGRLGWMGEMGDGALMWMAMSELARTAMQDMTDSKSMKRAMANAKIEAKKTNIASTEKQIKHEREEAERAFNDAVIMAVVMCAISCAAACAGSVGSAISTAASSVSSVYGSYKTMHSKTEGPQRKADDARLKGMRWDQEAEMMDQMVEEAQNNYDESKELFKLALRILGEHYELQSQATQSITRG